MTLDLLEEESTLINIITCREMETNLRFPGWHSGMVVGNLKLIEFAGDRAKRLVDEFDLLEFMDEFLAAGRSRFALIR